MPKFRYKTQDKGGRIEESVIEAPDRFAVYKQVRKEGRTVVSVTEEGVSGGAVRFLNMEYLNSLIGNVKTSEKIILTRNLSAMIGAGLVLSRALDVMERQTKNAKLRSILHSINTDVKKGETFSDALKKFPKVFSPLFISMVRAGEESGSLGESLDVVGEQMDKSYLLRKKIKGAMVYPAIIITAMFIIGIFMFIFVVPTLSQTFTEHILGNRPCPRGHCSVYQWSAHKAGKSDVRMVHFARPCHQYTCARGQFGENGKNIFISFVIRRGYH